MTKKTLIIIAGVGVFVVGVGIFLLTIIGYYNQSVDLKYSFEEKMFERTAFYTKMSTIISQKAKVAERNDSSFKDVVNAIMGAREDGANVMFKWIKEANPAASFSEVSKLFADLSRTIESQREGFFEEEKMIQDIVKQHNVLLERFPSSLVFTFLGVQHLEYKPIQSTKGKKVMESGIDDNVEVFN